MVVIVHEAELTAQRAQRTAEVQACELVTLRKQNGDFEQRLSSAEVRNTVHLAAQQAVENMLEATENLHVARVTSMQHRITTLEGMVHAQKTEVRTPCCDCDDDGRGAHERLPSACLCM